MPCALLVETTLLCAGWFSHGSSGCFISYLNNTGGGVKESPWRYVSGFFTVLFTGTRVHVTVKDADSSHDAEINPAQGIQMRS